MLDRQRNPLENEVLGGPIASAPVARIRPIVLMNCFISTLRGPRKTPPIQRQTIKMPLNPPIQRQTRKMPPKTTNSKKGVNISLFYLLSRELEVDITDVESLPRGVSPPWDS